jgi:hypothetical protein
MRTLCLLFACSWLLACSAPFETAPPTPGGDSGPDERPAFTSGDAGGQPVPSSDAGDSRLGLLPVKHADASTATDTGASETSSASPSDASPAPEASGGDASPGLDGGSGIPSGCAVVSCAPRDPSCCQALGFASYCGASGGGWLCCGGCP